MDFKKINAPTSTVTYDRDKIDSQSENIYFRYKNRVSLKLIDTPNENISVGAKSRGRTTSSMTSFAM